MDVTNLPGGAASQSLGPLPALAANTTGADIREDIIDFVNPFGEFRATEIDETVEVLHNQFGANRAVVTVTYTPTMSVERATGNMVISSGDTIGALVTQSTSNADVERPWDSGVLNEARTFVVSGGTDDIFAYDLGGSFNTDAITAFVERRNFQLEPLNDTESLSGFYMHTDSLTPTDPISLDIKLQGVNNATTPLNLDLPVGDPQRYVFNIGGPDGSGDYKIDTRINARLLNFRISNTGITEWELQSFGIGVEKGGTR